jgi:acetoin utilization deacetylase AcuC-like enzyme
MKILYIESILKGYDKLGIEIPIPSDRGEAVIGALKAVKGDELPFYTKRSEGYGAEDLLLAHSKEYIGRLFGKPEEARQVVMEAFELVNPDGSYNRFDPAKAAFPLEMAVGPLKSYVDNTWTAVHAALDGEGPVFYLGGGQHHARVNGPSGFCMLNDVALGALRAVKEGAGLVWIIDVDVHKGDGTAEILAASRWGELPLRTYVGKNPEIINLSIHMAHGWPLDNESLTHDPMKAPFAPSSIDINQEEWEDSLYVARLRAGLMEMERRSGGRKPDRAIVVDGADPYEYDGLPSSSSIKLTLEQCLERDMLVYNFLAERKVPSAWVMAGGYGPRAWEPVAAFLKTVV